MSVCLVTSPVVARASPLPARRDRRLAPSALHRSSALVDARRVVVAGARVAPRSCALAAASAWRAAAAAEEDDEPWEIDLQVTGMVCDGCASNVKNALAAAQGVVNVVAVDLASGVATVEVKAATAVRYHAC